MEKVKPLVVEGCSDWFVTDGFVLATVTTLDSFDPRHNDLIRRTRTYHNSDLYILTFKEKGTNGSIENHKVSNPHVNNVAKLFSFGTVGTLPVKPLSEAVVFRQHPYSPYELYYRLSAKDVGLGRKCGLRRIRAGQLQYFFVKEHDQDNLQLVLDEIGRLSGPYSLMNS